MKEILNSPLIAGIVFSVIGIVSVVFRGPLLVTAVCGVVGFIYSKKAFGPAKGNEKLVAVFGMILGIAPVLLILAFYLKG